MRSTGCTRKALFIVIRTRHVAAVAAQVVAQWAWANACRRVHRYHSVRPIWTLACSSDISIQVSFTAPASASRWVSSAWWTGSRCQWSVLTWVHQLHLCPRRRRVAQAPDACRRRHVHRPIRVIGRVARHPFRTTCRLALYLACPSPFITIPLRIVDNLGRWFNQLFYITFLLNYLLNQYITIFLLFLSKNWPIFFSGSFPSSLSGNLVPRWNIIERKQLNWDKLLLFLNLIGSLWFWKLF